MHRDFTLTISFSACLSNSIQEQTKLKKSSFFALLFIWLDKKWTFVAELHVICTTCTLLPSTRLWRQESRRYKHYISYDWKATAALIFHPSPTCAAVRYVSWNCGQLCIRRAVDKFISGIGGIIINRGKPKCLERHLPQCPPQMPYELHLERTRSSVVRKRWLTSWDMTQNLD